MQKAVYISLVCLLLTFTAKAQLNYSAYYDIQNRFYLFDNGEKVQLEAVLPREYKIGRTGLAYLDNMGLFKVYRNGVKNVINDIFTAEYTVTDNLIVYKGANALHVIDGDEDAVLTNLVGEYATGDSVVMYFDKVKNVLHAYYAGTNYDLENNLANTEFSNYKVSDNVIAYINFMGQLKVFWQGSNELLEVQQVTNLQVGRNTVAYTDINGQFKIWHKGVLTTVDAFKPSQFQVGDNVVAYVAYDGNFKIFYDGQTTTLGFFDKQFKVTDNIVNYEDGAGFYNIFYKGKTYMVDNFFPSSITSGYNSTAYINRANTLRLFSAGKFYEVTNMVKSLEDIRLDYDVLQYQIGRNMFRFFIDGKEY
jgi:hypothetical protein